MRRMTALILCVIMALGAAPLEAAAATQTTADMHAEVLKELNLMAGTPTGMKLHLKLNRVEAITMLIHMMGGDAAVKTGTYSHPFTDVPTWADPFVGYAYENGLTSGVAADRFGSNNDCTQAQYLTFILRSLGYSDARGEFTWDNPYALAKSAGLIDSVTPLRRFSRGDMATISFHALTSEIVAYKEVELSTDGAISMDMPEAKPMPDSSSQEPVQLPDALTSEAVSGEEVVAQEAATSGAAVTTESAITSGGAVSEGKKPELLKDRLISKGIFTQEAYDVSMADFKAGPKAVKAVYLTFDDGPSTKVTPRILNTLKENGIPATFFVLGSQVDRNPEILRRTYDEGHKIANHGYSHNYSHMYKSTTNLMNDLNSGNAAIDRALGFAYGNNVFRFPGGSHQKSSALKNAVKNAGHKYYDWTSSGQDSISAKGSSAQFIYDSTINTIWGDRNNVIVLLHDTNAKGTTADALPRIIKYFRDNGYEFRTL